MGYLIFNDVSTTTLPNVYVSQMPSHKKAAMRFSEYYVKGRDGALHVDEGYENYNLTAVLVLVNASAESRYLVNAWADGTGKLITSDDLTKAYRASVKEEVIWQRVRAQSVVKQFSPTKAYANNDFVTYGGAFYRFNKAHTGAWNYNDVDAYYITDGLFDTATITFNCQPCMYESIDRTITLNASGSVYNVGNAVSYPMLSVSGSGNGSFEVNGNLIEIDGMTSGVPVNIDCENGYVYTAAGAKTIRGDIPFFDYGLNANNIITFGSNISSIVIHPNWRWV